MNVLRMLSAVSLLSISFAMSANDSPANAGIRLAEIRGPGKVSLVVGPGVNLADVQRKPSMFQVVSDTDELFLRGVPARSAEVTGKGDDASYPPNWSGPVFVKADIALELPPGVEMTHGHKYWIRCPSAFLFGSNRRAKWLAELNSTPKGDLKTAYGIRAIHAVSSTLLNVSTGSGVSIRNILPKGIAVTSPDDPDFAQPLQPVEIGRRSVLDFYTPVGWPWKFHQKHELYLVLDKPMKQGKSYVVELNADRLKPIACGISSASLKFEDKVSVNPAIKTNQVAYLPDAVKFAYVGLWMGDLNAYDFTRHNGSFEVRDAKTHQAVLTGKPEPRGKPTYKLVDGIVSPNPKDVKGTETAHKIDLSYEDVWELDFSALRTPGAYYVVIPGIGRGLDFKIASDAYSVPFKTVMSGILHQRCGIELKPPYAVVYRPACHRNNTELSTFAVGMDGDPQKRLAECATDGAKRDIWGGHHDAGDWNPRSHIDVAENLMLLYELNKDAFFDGQLELPDNERRNGIPDVIDEALWALNLWSRLQDADGGVRGGIESAGDPKEGDDAETDSLREFAFAKDAASSLRFAAAAAQMAFIFKGIGKLDKSVEWLARARKAWDWAKANQDKPVNDVRALAAAQLLRATGDKEYDDEFQKVSVVAIDPQAPLQQHKKYDQTAASFYYAVNPAAGSGNLRKDIVAAFEREFKESRKWAETTKYRHMRHPWAPTTWGTGGLPIWLSMPAMTAHLTAVPELKESAINWIRFTCDFSLGCNPLGMVFTTGLGQRYVGNCWNHLMEDTPAGIIPGLQTEGPGGRWTAGQMPKGGSMVDWPGMSCHPSGDWPDLYKYMDGAAPGMSEGVIRNQALTALAYGLLMQPRLRLPPSK